MPFHARVVAEGRDRSVSLRASGGVVERPSAWDLAGALVAFILLCSVAVISITLGLSTETKSAHPYAMTVLAYVVSFSLLAVSGARLVRSARSGRRAGL